LTASPHRIVLKKCAKTLETSDLRNYYSVHPNKPKCCGRSLLFFREWQNMEGLTQKTFVNRVASPELLKQIKAQMVREYAPPETISAMLRKAKGGYMRRRVRSLSKA
jgi:hypothetical protein